MEEETNETLEHSNEIIEINTETGEFTSLEQQVEEDSNISVKKKKKKKLKLFNFWRKFSKKKKITILIIISAVLLLIIGVLLYFIVFKDNKLIQEKEPVVVIEKDNYRYEDGKLTFLDAKEKEIGTYECKNKSEKKCYVANYSNEDEFDVPTIVDENNQKIEKLSKIFNNNFVFIYDNDKEGNLLLYDIKKQKELDEFRLIKEYKDNNVIAVDKENHYGVLNFAKDVTESIDFKYDYLGFITSLNNLVAKNGEYSQLINSTGDEISKNIKGEIKQYNDKYISVLIDEKYYLYDYNGIISLNKENDYYNFYEGYVITINNKKLTVYDSNMNILNIDPVKLENKYYNPVITVDSNYKEVDSKEAYAIALNSDNLSIEVNGEYVLINIYTGKVNNNYKFISYSNGKIYVYSDLEKEVLLGEYSCSNLNIVGSNSTKYDTCTLANETELLNRGIDTTDIGLLPIYNNRYIFIKDGDFITLWDLKETNKKAVYTEVDAGYYAKDFGFVTTEGCLVMAKNATGSYGIIKIDTSSVNGVIAFKDNDHGGATTSIKFLDNNILVTRADGKYYLYKDTGGKNPIAVSTEPILQYNPKGIKVQGPNDTFAVNTLNGKVILGNLLYVEMDEEYFVAVNNDKKINIYKYEENAKGLITDNIPALTDDNYENSFKIINNNLVVGGVFYPFNISGE